MPVGQDGVKRVLYAFEQGEWDEIHLVADDVEVHLVAGGRHSHEVATSHVIAPDETSDVAQATSVGPVVAAVEGAAAVVSPSPGIFWRAPSPGAPPFTEVGERVEQGAALCIVEVMKLMNTLPAPVSGTVVEICADNGEQVDTGRPLFRIRPDGS
ncbi:MAG: acetyl-CoA carboxylase biotin carboxyl carrier protein subunit [Pseudonocardia sp.]